MTYLLPIAVVLAQAPTPPATSAATTGTATVSLLVLCAAAAWMMVKTKGAQWPHIGIGVAIGVVGSATFIGAITWSILDIVINVVNQIGSAVH
jgi:hypothetical protein